MERGQRLLSTKETDIETLFLNVGLPKLIRDKEFKGFNSYIICPHLNGDWSHVDGWANDTSKKYLDELLDKLLKDFIPQHNIDTDNIIIMGHSKGGTGAIYMAKHLPKYFSKLVVQSGYGNDVNLKDIKIPAIGYVGEKDDEASVKYMTSVFSKKFETIEIDEAGHGEVPKGAFTLDEDNNGYSDLVEWMFGDYEATKTKETSFFSSNITFSWDFIENDDIMDYGICIPSNAKDCDEIPLIIWLHGLAQQGGDGNAISTAYDGFPKAILEESSLDGFSAYVVCPHIPVYNEKGRIWNRSQMEALLNKLFQKYNIDEDNVVIMGHSLGANNAIALASQMPDYFSKAAIFSGGLEMYPTIPIKWYVGDNEVEYYLKAARKYENHYGEGVVCWLPGAGHQTPIPAYNKDDGTFVGKGRK